MNDTAIATPIVTRGLTKHFGERCAVDAVDLSVEQGEVFGFVGLNGAGKTTFMRMLVGLAKPTAGTFSILGTSNLAGGVMRRVGTMIETPAFHAAMTGRENLRYIARFAGFDDAAVRRALDEVDLNSKADEPFRTYSLGMKQRLGLACALLGEPELLILDEPANGLDPSGIAALRDLLRGQAAQGRTIFLSSHLLSEIAQICDRVGVLHEGSLVTIGTPQEIENPTTDVSGIVVECGEPELAAKLVDGLPGVSEVRQTATGIKVLAPGARTADIVTALVGGGISLHSVTQCDRTLEEAFLAMTVNNSSAAHDPEVM